MDVIGPAAEHGLAALHGSSPDVGVVGYSLGGGVSWYSRRYGLAASRVLAVELVTADGRPVRVDRRQIRNLLWALRGGGGSFGVAPTAKAVDTIVEQSQAAQTFGCELSHTRRRPWVAASPTAPRRTSTLQCCSSRRASPRRSRRPPREAEKTSFEAALPPYAADRTYPRLRGARHEPGPYPGHRDARPAA